MVRSQEDNRLMILRKRVAEVPLKPGVYRWMDKDGSVMYVGKAKSLRNRMKSYVQEGPQPSPFGLRPAGKRSAWTEIMVRQIADFDVTVVRNELEALILEANLIKQLKPKFNVLLKDDKGYAYVRLTREKYPRVGLVWRMDPSDVRASGAKYFGPFLGAWGPRQTLDMLDGILKFTACKKSLDALNHPTPGSAKVLGTPCLDYQIGKCCGLCVGAVTEADYCQRIAEVEHFFRGHYGAIKKKAQEQMKAAAAEQKFERAARTRDVLKFIDELESKQIVSDTSGENADIFGIALRRGKIQVILLRERDGKVVERVDFALKGEAESASDALAQFLPQYYGETQDIPGLILLPEAIEEQATMETWLREKADKAVHIVVPERGKKSKLLELASKNAEQKVEQQFAAWEAEAQKVESALIELAGLLGLKEPPRRIEGYDISHLGGTATVASMVVFLHGKAKREHYRSFNMRTVKEGDIDDYKSLAEALRRRLKYLTDDLKTSIARCEEGGINISKARKAEQKTIEEIVKAHPESLGAENLDYKNFLVARRDEKIVGFAQLYSYSPSVRAIRTVWIDAAERGKRLGQLIVRCLLKGIEKGKAYVTLPADLEEYYAELGFRHVEEGPVVLEELLQKIAKEYPDQPRGIMLMYEAKQNKPDVSFTDRPDLLLIDGGKGQLSAAKAVLDDMKLEIPIASLAKREEEIFLPDSSDPLIVQNDSQARFLLQRIRDESHRFANAKREKRLDLSMFVSKLDEIPGVGPQSKSALLKKFGSADAALAASDEELKAVLNDVQLKALREKFPRA